MFINNIQDLDKQLKTLLELLAYLIFKLTKSIVLDLNKYPGMFYRVRSDIQYEGRNPRR